MPERKGWGCHILCVPRCCCCTMRRWLLAASATAAHVSLCPAGCTSTRPPALPPLHRSARATHALPAADTSAQAASLAATLKPVSGLPRHLQNGTGNGVAGEEIFEEMGDIGLKPVTVYHNLRWVGSY